MDGHIDWTMEIIQLGLTIWALVILMRIETKLDGKEN